MAHNSWGSAAWPCSSIIGPPGHKCALDSPCTERKGANTIDICGVSCQDGSDVSVEVAVEGAAGRNDASRTTDHGTTVEVTIKSLPWCGRYAVPSQDFTAATVGAKSLNTIRLQVTLIT